MSDNVVFIQNYYPNTFGGPRPEPKARWPSITVKGAAARHPYDHPNSDYSQPRALYEKVMTDVDRENLIGNIVDHLGGAKREIQLRQTAIFLRVHEEYGSKVALGLGLDVEEVKKEAEK